MPSRTAALVPQSGRGPVVDDGVNPDVVLVGIGDNPTLEVMAAASLLRQDFPELRVRVVNVTDLLVLEENTRPSSWSGRRYV